jgi:putative copper export protein
MVALAAVNRIWLTPRFSAGDRTAPRRLFATILCEQVLAAAVLLAAATLGQLDPYA